MENSVEQAKLNKRGDSRGMHPNSRANLMPPRWTKGNSGNPEGLSLKRRISDILRELVTDQMDLKTARKIDLLARTIVQDAIKGSKEDRKEIWDRLEGKLGLTVGGGDQPIKHIIEVVDAETKKITEEILRGEGGS